jgi:hypothetical protein
MNSSFKITGPCWTLEDIEIRRIKVQSQPRQIVCETLSPK